MSLKVVRSLAEDQWRKFVDGHAQSNVFHTPEMFQVFSRTRNHEPELFAVLDESHILALIVPVHVALKDGSLSRFTARSIVYGSILCVPGAQGSEALELMLKSYLQSLKRTSLFAELRHISDAGIYQPVLQRLGFEYVNQLNYLVDLNRSTESLFQSFGRRTRKHLSRAMKKNEIEIEEIHDRAGVADCYDLIRQSYHFAHVPLADRSLFDAAFDILHPRKMVRFSIARVNGKRAAASIDLLYKNVVYGWYGGIDREVCKDGANEYLTWDVFRWGAEQGYRIYDWGGAGIAGEEYHVRDFKSKFGGELVSFGRHTYVVSRPILKLGKAAYSLLRPFF